MSVVTNVMILCNLDPTEKEKFKTHLLKFTKNNPQFKYIHPCDVGGEKCLESDVFIGAFNLMDAKLLCEVVLQSKKILSYDSFIDMQVMIKCDNEDRWTLYRADEIGVFISEFSTE